jgi:DnaJ-class molecular chaperone with C-terminal Zn finger domain
MRTYYDILGIKKGASEKEIKSAYRRLARKNHPDMNQGDKAAEERFKEISEAYEVLADKKQHEIYNQVGHQAWKAGYKQGGPPPGTGGPHFGGFRPGPGQGFPEDFFRQGPSSRRVNVDADDVLSDLNLNDILGGLFGGGRGRRRKAATPERGEDIQSRLAVAMADALRGGERKITIMGENGNSETLTVKIPSAIREGQRIRLAGKGGPGIRGGPPGDLLIEIMYEPDDRFVREGDNLTMDVTVPFSVAALGGTASVATLDGAAELKIPAGTQGGQRMRLKGKGLPRKAGERGDLYARVRVAVPRRLDDEGRKLVEKLRSYE